MNTIDFNFLNFSITDFIDIILVALIVYYIYSLIRNTLAVNLMLGLLIIILCWFVVGALKMQLLTAIINKFINVGIIALVVIFQPEIRRFLLHIGKNTFWQKNKNWWNQIFGIKTIESNNLMLIKPIIEACKSLKKGKIGALIVFVKFYDDPLFTASGEIINAKISKRLLESIFQKNSPLHDGAVVIAENKIKSASCILPLSESNKLPAQFGLRHRAGIGVSEAMDAVAIIISEETGEISFAKQGKVRANITFIELEKLLSRDF
ncbi:MAG: diadenylate cyclase CdaA [Sphingobacteriaceae bacterium]|nr:diadenylate cyclase CdaA [Sphingobacteriaceae bacterium]